MCRHWPQATSGYPQHRRVLLESHQPPCHRTDSICRNGQCCITRTRHASTTASATATATADIHWSGLLCAKHPLLSTRVSDYCPAPIPPNSANAHLRHQLRLHRRRYAPQYRSAAKCRAGSSSNDTAVPSPAIPVFSAPTTSSHELHGGFRRPAGPYNPSTTTIPQ